MSLPLRKAVQPILDTAKLESYHAAISDEKYFQIVGECGKPLFTITGIEFTRKEPTIADIEFSIELFEEFLLKHKVKLDNFMAKGAKFNAMKAPKMPNNYKLIMSYTQNLEVDYTDQDLLHEVYLFDAGKRVEVSIQNKKLSIAKMRKFAINQDKLDIAVSTLKKQNTYNIAKQEVEDARNALSSCEI